MKRYTVLHWEWDFLETLRAVQGGCEESKREVLEEGLDEWVLYGIVSLGEIDRDLDGDFEVSARDCVRLAAQLIHEAEMTSKYLRLA